MSQDTENFESLRRLLALKRYEQPPPGYFNNFSSQVIARIQLGEMGEARAFSRRAMWETGWLQRIWAAFEAKPILAGAFAMVVFGLLITGVIYSEKTDVQPVALMPAPELVPATLEVANAAANLTPGSHLLLAKPPSFEGSPTGPAAADVLLMGSLHPQRAVFAIPGGN